MSVSNLFVTKAYGQNQPLIQVYPAPIIAQRAPLTTDRAPLGTEWVDQPASAIYFLASVVANVSTWIQVTAGGGAGVFSSLTVTPGPINMTGTTNINAAGAAVTSIGNAAAGVVNVISPILDLDSSINGLIEIGTSVSTGTIGIGGSLTSGALHLGNHASTNTVSAQSGTGGWNFVTGGLVSFDFIQDTVASPTATAVINARQCYANFTGFTTAAAGKQVFVITNSIITAGSSLLVTAMNLGSNDAEMTVTRVQPGAGTVSITLTNNGAAALNGDVNITLFVCD